MQPAPAPDLLRRTDQSSPSAWRHSYAGEPGTLWAPPPRVLRPSTPQMPGYQRRHTTMPGMLDVPDVPDVWEYHNRQASLRHASTTQWHTPQVERPSVLHAAFQISSAPADEGGRVVSSRPSVSKKDRICRVTAAGTAFVMALLAMLSSSWQQQTVAATPEELHKVYATMMSILPGEHRMEQPRSFSKNVQPVFELQAGLFSAYVVDLCTPSPGFDYVVDKAACERKLEGFCDSLRDSTPNDKWLRAADKAHKSCLKTVRGKQGISVPLLGGPVHQLWGSDRSSRRLMRESSEDVVDQLRREFEVGPSDWMPNFCATVANCEQLEAMRPWNIAVVIAFVAGVLLLLVSTGAFIYDLLRPDVKHSSRGFLLLGLAFGCLTTAALLYLHVAQTYPVSSYIRSESLFYFMLAEPGDMSRRLTDVSHGAESPTKRWKGVLLSLTGSLLQGLLAGDMSTVYKQLQEAVERAWQLADVLFQRWLKYLHFAVEQAPKDGTLLLRDAAAKLQELDRGVLSLAEIDNSTQEGVVLAGLGQQLHEQTEQLLAFNGQAIQLVSDGEVVVHAIVRSWQDLRTPVVDLIQHIRDAWKGGVLNQLVSFAKDLALDKATIADLKMIFTRLSDTLPKVVKGAQKVADDFRRLTESFGPLAKQMRRTLQSSASCFQRLAALEINQTRDEMLRQAKSVVEDLQKPGGLKKVSEIWSNFAAQDLLEAFGPGNASDHVETGRLLLETDRAISMLVEPLARASFNPMDRITTIFLYQLQSLGRTASLRPMQEPTCRATPLLHPDAFGLHELGLELLLLGFGPGFLAVRPRQAFASEAD
eukprot:s516_g11.t1